MNKLIALAVRISGLGWIWDRVNGYKTKIGAVSLILSGLAELLQKISSLSDLASAIAFIKILPNDAGWIALIAGIAALGLGHKMDKAKDIPPAP